MLWPLSWLLATSLGWAIGWYVGATFYGETFGGFVSGGLGGSLGSIGQAAVVALGDRRLGALWALGSVGPWLGGLGLGIALSSMTAGGIHPTLAAIPLAVAFMALGQWLTLRSRYERAGWWPIALLLGVVVGGSAVSLLQLASGGAVLGAVGGVTLGGGIGLTTGLTFSRFRSRIREASRSAA